MFFWKIEFLKHLRREYALPLYSSMVHSQNAFAHTMSRINTFDIWTKRPSQKKRSSYNRSRPVSVPIQKLSILKRYSRAVGNCFRHIRSRGPTVFEMFWWNILTKCLFNPYRHIWSKNLIHLYIINWLHSWRRVWGEIRPVETIVWNCLITGAARTRGQGGYLPS